QYYIVTSRELARLIGVCKAPIIQHFAESISGAATIRSFDQESRFMNTNLHLIDGFSRPSFHSDGALQWLCFRLDLLANLVRYGPHLPLVLKGLTCTFPGGKKVGIVGRTGCGKSTLIQSLFRIVDPTGGRIVIDGIDILRIGLHDLRCKLSIIPQDPTMFEGTVRNNLDPLGDYSDEEIWEALEKCQLGKVVQAKEEKLDSLVTENGENWSMGQRQLVCLGRVLLKRSRILVLDEATASVDTATDGLIQHTIRNQFSDCTVITIAHRIPSVCDSDLVLVLSDGKIAEYDSPTKLLEDKSSSFAKLVSEYTMRSTNADAK
ncbi:hypothetical protein KI387_003310, partial [Taxus chinensis]